MGMGIGAAMTGLRPIVEGMNMGFLLLAYNQISNNAGMLHYTSGGQFKVRCAGASCAFWLLSSGQGVLCWSVVCLWAAWTAGNTELARVQACQAGALVRCNIA